MGLVLKLDGMKDDASVHAKVYEEVKKVASEEEFYELTSPYHDYRSGVYRDHKAYSEQLPFYSIKPLFIVICWLFYKSGFNLFESTVLPGICIYYVLGLFVLLFLNKRHGGLVSIVGAGLFMLLPSTQELSTLSTPDSISTTFMIFGAIRALDNYRNWLSPILFLLALLTRPDNILFINFFYLYLLVAHRDERMTVVKNIGLVAVMSLIYLLVVNLSGNPGWQVLFAHSFDGRMLYPLTEPRYIGWDDYWRIMDQRHDLFATKYIIYFLFG
jgi:Gpi18-like mannosyltransferase